MNKTVLCLSQMTACKGKREELLAGLKQLVDPSRAEDGCLEYEIWQDKKNDHSLIVYERFVDQQALDDHVASPYVQAFVSGVYAQCVESHWDLDLQEITP